MEARLLQYRNAPLPILVTLSGMVMEARLLQHSNALPPILVTLSGMVMEVREELMNALSQIPIVPSATSILPTDGPLTLYRNFPIYTNPSGRLSYHAVPSNAPLPILVTLSGMVMEARLLQPSNAKSPILVTLSGMVMEARLLQS